MIKTFSVTTKAKPTGNTEPTVTIYDNLTIIQDNLLNLPFSITDIDGDTVIVTTTKEPAHGTVVVGDDNVVYTPEAGYSGSDSFTLSFDDGQGGVIEKSILVIIDAKSGENITTIDGDEDNITVASITNIISLIKGAVIVKDKETEETTFYVDRNITEEAGFAYRAIIKVDKEGRTKTRIIKINLATDEETLIEYTLKEEYAYETGNRVEISIVNGVLVIKITAKINKPLQFN